MAIINRSIIHLTGCQPRTLASLMELQDSSFRRLLRLAPQLRQMRGTFTSRVADALDLHLSVIEKFKYTTTILLTYEFAGGAGTLVEPNVTIRLYHDARLAEVISDARRHHRDENPAVNFRRCLGTEVTGNGHGKSRFACFV